MRLGVLFDNYGPYHLARLRAAAAALDVVAIQVATTSCDYAWSVGDASRGFPLATVGDRPLDDVLDELDVTVLAVPGWSSRASFQATSWACRRRVPLIVMSESSKTDASRASWAEVVKKRFLSNASASLAGGSRHRDYLLKLGMAGDRIFLGYDAVDNDYFRRSALDVRRNGETTRARWELPSRYWLASSRFIPKKNLLRLLSAYADYRRQAGPGAWDFVLLGDGELRPSIERTIADLGLTGSVRLPGFQQYAALPTYYALASGFVHASTVEQWGLVVNEAMACGLPVLVSQRCGCADELVQAGKNGWTFDPFDQSALIDLMVRLTRCNDCDRARIGGESQRIVANWGVERFAAGLASAADKALEVGPARPSVANRLLLRALTATASRRTHGESRAESGGSTSPTRFVSESAPAPTEARS